MTPDTCLIVTIRGKTVSRMAGIAVYCGPYPAPPWKTGPPVGNHNRMASHTGQGIHIGHGIVYMIYGICLASCNRLNMAAHAVGDLNLIKCAAIKSKMRGYSYPHLAYVHNGWVCGMTPDTRIIPGILGHTMCRMAGIATPGICGPMSNYCKTMTTKTGPFFNKSPGIVYMF